MRLQSFFLLALFLGSSGCTLFHPPNLAARGSGGRVVEQSHELFGRLIDGEDDEVLWFRNGEEAVFAFRDGRSALIHEAALPIMETKPWNLKSFDLFYAEEKPENFKKIGRFTLKNERTGRDPYQRFSFPPVRARYVKFKLVSSYAPSLTDGYPLYEIRIHGKLE